mgnify:CR=1 FL=1
MSALASIGEAEGRSGVDVVGIELNGLMEMNTSFIEFAFVRESCPEIEMQVGFSGSSFSRI